MKLIIRPHNPIKKYIYLLLFAVSICLLTAIVVDYGSWKYLSNIVAQNQDYQNLLREVADLEKENKRLYLDIARFKKSEDHPKAKLLKNRAATIAALIGVGYALSEMRGRRDYKVDTMRSNSIGEFGAYAVGSGTHMSPFIGPGTAQGAANVGVSSGSLWIGAAADLAFNSAVDIAAIFGAGKLARTIGTPIYQQVELAASALAAGHLGPRREVVYNGSDRYLRK